MITCDTSILVAAFARWHDDHGPASSALSRVDTLVDHVAIETFSLLTRLPAPRRVPAHLVFEFLNHHFATSVPRLPSPTSSDLLATADQSGISGGAVYDLVVALAAARHGATLLSLDKRATPTNEAAGVGYELISGTRSGHDDEPSAVIRSSNATGLRSKAPEVMRRI